MRIGDGVTFNGRRYVVVGFTPLAVTPFRVELRDPDSGNSFWVEWPTVERAERAALKLVTEKKPEPAD
jgi:hypothetical protein